MEKLKQTLNEQSDKISKLEEKINTQQKAEKMTTLRVTGLPENANEASEKLVEIARNKLETPVMPGEFLLQAVRRSKPEKPMTYLV